MVLDAGCAVGLALLVVLVLGDAVAVCLLADELEGIKLATELGRTIKVQAYAVDGLSVILQARLAAVLAGAVVVQSGLCSRSQPMTRRTGHKMANLPGRTSCRLGCWRRARYRCSPGLCTSCLFYRCEQWFSLRDGREVCGSECVIRD